ncbi:prephenate dehydrogenase [Planomicrobium sp. YIM 101495]|uniref:prephenate dehydrogenase n=1 Tax=Planomicrobium sp. YIM 101495 TaxID=2665160 RepID=UPI0012B97E12|nr:prephenate dehydrogenase [Planomicrobium sp. YIM 101495]MTD30058.1 prephenate dehydrogenase [Planomicrobium sp. YIM 101495]
MMRHVFIIGLGLIGGSLARALQRNENLLVTGFDSDPLAVTKALKMGVVQEAPRNIEEGVKRADWIIFATPVGATLTLMEQCKTWETKDTAVFSDTGSTKVIIMEAAERLGLRFIGGHPMAGSHKSGVEAAKDVLFENAFYILTPTAALIGGEEVEQLHELLKVTKAKVHVMQAFEHDEMTAIVSHFPHLIAASLVHQLDKQEQYPFAKQLAAGGFRDITRIASSNPDMWRDITIQNNPVILAQLDNWMAEMADLKQLLTENNGDSIKQYFNDAKQVRDALPIAGHGAFYSAFDLYVDVPDVPGVLAEVMGHLAEEQISIVNLRILETREDVFGILVISFQTSEDRADAERCLSKRTDFDTYIS